MSIPWPRCGDEEPHPAHRGPAGHDCPGWTEEQQLIRHLVTSVNEYVREHYPLSGPPYRRPLPDGLRLEMHHSLRRLLMTDPDLWERPGLETNVGDWFLVPVKVTTDLKADQWRLVIVTEKILMLGGRMPADGPVDYYGNPAMTGWKKRS